MADGLMNRYPTSLIIRKMQIKTTIRYHLTPIRTAIIINRTKLTSVGEDVEKREPFCLGSGNVNWCSYD